MTDAEIRRHCAVDHKQGAYCYVGGEDGLPVSTAEQLEKWHSMEHAPHGHRSTHLAHAHDEFSARYLGVALHGA